MNHLGQLPSVTISFNLAQGFALGSAVNEVQRLGRKIIPADISAVFRGRPRHSNLRSRVWAFYSIMAILVIYLVLGILYESFVHPVTILAALPFAGFGALIA